MTPSCLDRRRMNLADSTRRLRSESAQSNARSRPEAGKFHDLVPNFRPASRTDRKKQVGGKQREMNTGLQECGAARKDGEHGHDARQGEEHDVGRVEAEMEGNGQPDRGDGDGWNGEPDAGHGGAEGEVEADLHSTSTRGAYRRERLWQEDEHRDDDSDH